MEDMWGDTARGVKERRQEETSEEVEQALDVPEQEPPRVGDRVMFFETLEKEGEAMRGLYFARAQPFMDGSSAAAVVWDDHTTDVEFLSELRGRLSDEEAASAEEKRMTTQPYVANMGYRAPSMAEEPSRHE